MIEIPVLKIQYQHFLRTKKMIDRESWSKRIEELCLDDDDKKVKLTLEGPDVPCLRSD